MPAQTRQLVTLGEAAREFARHRSPQLLLAELAVLLAARAAWPSWSWGDLVVAGSLVAAQPFTEWVVHVVVLHCPADGRLRDRLAGRSHRRHHEDPRDLRFQFVHPRAVYGGTAVLLAVLLLVRTPAALTGVTVAAALTLTYEWVHFLIHTDVVPRSAAYRRLHRAHRLHHFRNERYWLGVTGRTGDRLLGTDPRKQDVEVSPTARTALARR